MDATQVKEMAELWTSFPCECGACMECRRKTIARAYLDQCADLARLRGVLEDIEWVIADTNWASCPSCGSPKTSGHHAECFLAAVLAEKGGE